MMKPTHSDNNCGAENATSLPNQSDVYLPERCDFEANRTPAEKENAAIDRQADPAAAAFDKEHGIVDEIDEASAESFPASDPPANW